MANDLLTEIRGALPFLAAYGGRLRARVGSGYSLQQGVPSAKACRRSRRSRSAPLASPWMTTGRLCPGRVPPTSRTEVA